MDAGGGGGSVKADINVTPLVDIVLVLLIIFIVITPAVNNAVVLPLAKHADKQEKEVGAKYLALMLPAIRQDGKVVGPARVMVDDPNAKDQFGNPLTFAFDNEDNRKKLIGFISDSTRKLADKRVFVKADAQLPFKHVNTLMQLCREGGADEASVVTSEDKSKEGGK